MIKMLLMAVVVVVIAVATMPMWGSCDLNYKTCSTWCELKHFNEDVKKAGCQAACSSDKLGCLGQQGVEKVDKFVEDMKK